MRFLDVWFADWDVMEGEGVLRMTPSRRTLKRLCLASVVCIALAGLVVAVYGVPPGSKALKRHAAEAAELDKDAERLEREASRVRGGAGDSNARIAEQFAGRAVGLRQRAEAARRRSQAAPTLGVWGDRAFWAAVGVLVLLAVVMPVIGMRERIDLVLADDHLLVKRRGQLVPAIDVHLGDLAGFVVCADRDIRVSGRERYVTDHGWRWSVTLKPLPDREVPPVRLIAAQEGSLPARPGSMPKRVRVVVEFLRKRTGLPMSGPVITDVSEVQQGFSKATMKKRTRRYRSPDE